MEVKEIFPDGSGLVELDDTRHQVNLSLLEAVTPGDFVIVHAGFAIEKLDQEEADTRISLFEELAEAHNRKLSDFR